MQQLKLSQDSTDQDQLNNFPNNFSLFGSERNDQINSAVSAPGSTSQTQANQNMQTVYIGDLPKDISMVELYEYIKTVAGECELVLKR